MQTEHRLNVLVKIDLAYYNFRSATVIMYRKWYVNKVSSSNVKDRKYVSISSMLSVRSQIKNSSHVVFLFKPRSGKYSYPTNNIYQMVKGGDKFLTLDNT